MSDSYLTQWIAKIDTGHIITEDDMATLARIRLALDKADQHHRQARDAQAILAALREPSDVVIVAMQSADSHGDVTDSQCYAMLCAAVAAAEQEVGA